MARYYQRPQNDIVDLTPQYPVEFYSKLMEQAQQNLNQASATGAAFMTDAYGQEFIDQASRDKAMALAQDPISKALDKDFVTPATIAKAVGQASQAIAPWKNINKVHLEQAKREQALRDKLGANYIGNSVMKQSLMTPEGNWINADDIKLTAGNREDLVQALAKDNAGRADLKRDFESKWNTILGGKAFEKKIKKVLGLTEEERVAEFVNNQEMAKKYLAQMPEFAKAIAASGADPVEYMTQEIDQWSKQLVRGYDYDSKYIDNPDYGGGNGDFPPQPPGYRVTPFTTNVEKIKEDISRIKKLVNYTPESRQIGKRGDTGNVSIALSGLVNYGNSGANYRNPHPTEEDFVKANKEYNRVMVDYPHIEDEARRELAKQGIRPKSNSKEDLLEFNKQVKNLTLDKLEKYASENALVSDYRIDFQDRSFEQGLAREIALNVTQQGLSDLEVYDNSGNSTTLGSLFAKDPDKVYATPNASGTFSLTKDGKTYTIPTHDADNAALNIVNQDATRTSKLMKTIFQNQYKVDRSAYEPMDLGYSIQIPINTDRGTTTIVGNPVYQYFRDPNGKNVLYRYIIDSNNEPFTVDGQLFMEPISIGEFQKNAATALYTQLNIPNYNKNTN